MSDWLEIFIPAFAVLFATIYIAWNFFRRKKLNNNILVNVFSEIKLSNLFRENKLTLILLFSGTVAALIYGLHPSTYKFLFPIEILDRPLINYTGLLILKLSLMLLFIVNIQCDLNILDKLHANSFESFALRINKLLTASVTFMLIGLFVTISSIGTLVIAIFASIHAKSVITRG
ncbi:MAG TPA: hypothetical protein VFM99_10775 [Chitinophagales bacterium]|nr:hypothetical protein [Chitinophagales bacterium]